MPSFNEKKCYKYLFLNSNKKDKEEFLTAGARKYLNDEKLQTF